MQKSYYLIIFCSLYIFHKFYLCLIREFYTIDLVHVEFKIGVVDKSNAKRKGKKTWNNKQAFKSSFLILHVLQYICYGTYLTDDNELFLLLWIPGEYSSQCWVNSSLTLWQSDWCSTLFYLCCIYTFVQYTCFT